MTQGADRVQASALFVKPPACSLEPGWVVFEDIFLIVTIRQSLADMSRNACNQAQLELTNSRIEAEVNRRTEELRESMEQTARASRQPRVGRSAMKQEPVDLEQCVDDALDSLELRINETGAVITRDEFPTVIGDRTMLTQLYQNLVSNALKFTDEASPTIEISVTQNDGHWVLGDLKEHEHLSRIPVVVLTTSEQEADILRSYDLGCNSYIQKPVDIDQFTESVRRLGTYWFNVVTLPSASVPA